MTSPTTSPKGPDMTDQTTGDPATEFRSAVQREAMQRWGLAARPIPADYYLAAAVRLAVEREARKDAEIARLRDELAEAREGGAKLLAVCEQFQAQRDLLLWLHAEAVHELEYARTAASYRPCAYQVIPGYSRDDGGYCIANATDGPHCKAHAEALREAASEETDEVLCTCGNPDKPGHCERCDDEAATEDQQ